MSRDIDTEELRPRQIFEMANGSVYMAAGPRDAAGAPRARLWCAHPPDAVTFEPPLIDLPLGQKVRVLSGADMDVHYHHDGYVETVFRREMDRRNEAMMQVHATQRRAEIERQRRERAGRSWWRKLVRSQ